MVVVGIDLGTQSLKAVVCDEALTVLGVAAVSHPTSYPRPGWAEQDPRAWEAALAPAVAGALSAAGRTADEVIAVALVGQLDGCVALDAQGTPLHPALIWQDRRAVDHVSSPPRLFEVTGQIADASHLVPKILWLRAHGIRAARYQLPIGYLVERLTGTSVLDPSHASTTMLFDLHAQRWSPELLAAFSIDVAELPEIRPASAAAGLLTARGAALLGLRAGIVVAVGTGDDFATPLGAGITRPGSIACVLGTAEVVGAVSETLVLDEPARRAAGDPWRALAEPMVETHTYPTGGYFVENPGWLSGGAVRWAASLLGCANDAELDALAASAPPGAGGVTFVPALAGAMTPVWRGHARGTLHGLTAAHDRSHVARAVLEGLACASRDVAQRLAALGLPARDVVVLGGGGRSDLWLQIRADMLGLPHRVAQHTDTSAVGAAMLALVAAGPTTDLVGATTDLVACAERIPQPARTVEPQASLDEVYARYRRLVAELAGLANSPWA